MVPSDGFFFFLLSIGLMHYDIMIIVCLSVCATCKCLVPDSRFARPCISVDHCLSVRLSVHLSVHLSVRLFVSLFVCLSVCIICK